jgi:uncharacterized membrane protein YfcA
MDGSLTGFPAQLFWGFLGLGFAVGSFGTLVGAGGGFLLVPALLLLFPQESPANVTAVSMAVVFCNAYAGTWAYARMGRIDYPAGLLLATAALPGAWLGTMVVGIIPREPFDLALGGLLVALGLYLMINPTRSTRLPVGPKPTTWADRSLVGAIGSAYLGLLSSILGIGGGILHVPFLIRFLDFPPHVATATSQMVLGVVTCTSVLVHFLQGSLGPVLMPTACIALGVTMGAPVGAALSARLRGPLLVRLLALALCAVAARLLWRFLRA